jgi:hypothetical protein
MPLTQEELDLIGTATACIDGVPRDTPHRMATDHTVASACYASDGRVFTGINVYHCKYPSQGERAMNFC